MDRKMDSSIRDPAGVLDETKAKMMGIYTGMVASKAMVARSVKGSDTLGFL